MSIVVDYTMKLIQKGTSEFHTYWYFLFFMERKEFIQKHWQISEAQRMPVPPSRIWSLVYVLLCIGHVLSGIESGIKYDEICGQIFREQGKIGENTKYLLLFDSQQINVQYQSVVCRGY